MQTHYTGKSFFTAVNVRLMGTDLKKIYNKLLKTYIKIKFATIAVSQTKNRWYPVQQENNSRVSIEPAKFLLYVISVGDTEAGKKGVGTRQQLVHAGQASTSLLQQNDHVYVDAGDTYWSLNHRSIWSANRTKGSIYHIARKIPCLSSVMKN